MSLNIYRGFTRHMISTLPTMLSCPCMLKYFIFILPNILIMVIRSYMVLVVHTKVAYYSCCVHDAENQEHENAFDLFMLIWLFLVTVYLFFCIQL